MSSYLFLDPGESTGWMYVSKTGIKSCGVLAKSSHRQVFEFLQDKCPSNEHTVIVFEGFHLFPSHANTLIGDKFYTCEIIGIIKYFHQINIDATDLIEQQPSDKKFAGPLEEEYKQIRTDSTQHSKDAYLHYQFYKRKHRVSI